MWDDENNTTAKKKLGVATGRYVGRYGSCRWVLLSVIRRANSGRDVLYGVMRRVRRGREKREKRRTRYTT